jgi:hypothetical protein
MEYSNARRYKFDEETKKEGMELTEVEKLQKAAELIESATGGKQQFDTLNGVPQIFADRPAGELAKHPHIDIRMTRRMAADKRYTVRFYAHLDMVGPGMDATALRALERELWAARMLLDALETQTFTPLKSELAQFAEWVDHREEQALTLEKNAVPIIGQLEDMERDPFNQWADIQIQRDRLLMRSCVEGLGLYAAALDPQSPKLAELRDLTEDLISYWGLDDGVGVIPMDNFLWSFDQRIHTAGTDIDTLLYRADTLNGLSLYTDEMSRTHGDEMKDYISAVNDLIQEIAAAWNDETPVHSDTSALIKETAQVETNIITQPSVENSKEKAASLEKPSVIEQIRAAQGMSKTSVKPKPERKQRNHAPER